jgi:hypothetical protein
MVMTMAKTPSLKASIRVFPISNKPYSKIAPWQSEF